MVQVQTTAQQDPAFASVFGGASVKPPKQHIQFEPKSKPDIQRLESFLSEELRTILGIGDETFSYGVERVTEDGQPFKSCFETCPPITDIRYPSDEDDMVQESKYAHSDFWQQLVKA